MKKFYKKIIGVFFSLLILSLFFAPNLKTNNDAYAAGSSTYPVYIYDKNVITDIIVDSELLPNNIFYVRNDGIYDSNNDCVYNFTTSILGLSNEANQVTPTYFINDSIEVYDGLNLYLIYNTLTITPLISPIINFTNYNPLNITNFNTLSWLSIENAISYDIFLNDTFLTNTTELTYIVNNSGVYKICAVGDGDTYTNSEFSNAIVLHKIQFNFLNSYLYNTDLDYILFDSSFNGYVSIFSDEGFYPFYYSNGGDILFYDDLNTYYVSFYFSFSDVEIDCFSYEFTTLSGDYVLKDLSNINFNTPQLILDYSFISNNSNFDSIFINSNGLNYDSTLIFNTDKSLSVDSYLYALVSFEDELIVPINSTLPEDCLYTDCTNFFNFYVPLNNQIIISLQTSNCQVSNQFENLTNGSDLEINIVVDSGYVLNNTSFVINGQFESYEIDLQTSTISFTNITDNIDLSIFAYLSQDLLEQQQEILNVNVDNLIEDNNLYIKTNIKLISKDLIDIKSINISKSESPNADVDFINYVLIFDDEKSTIDNCVYEVQNFVIESTAIRFYTISSIYRAFNSIVDIEPNYDNTITEKAVSVACKYKFENKTNGTKITFEKINVITITDKFVGFVRYENGFLSLNSSCDAHFVAFSTDKPIDELLSASLYYSTQSYEHWSGLFFTNNYIVEKESHYNSIYANENVFYKPWLFLNSTEYSWNRIYDTSTYLSTLSNYDNLHSEVETTDFVSDNISSKDFILFFVETDYINTPYTVFTNKHEEYTKVSDVSILRLEYITNGDYFNEAVIDDKTTGSDDPSIVIRQNSPINSVKNWFDKILDFIKDKGWLILVAIALLICLPILPTIIRFIISIIMFVVMIPINIIKLIFKKRK